MICYISALLKVRKNETTVYHAFIEASDIHGIRESLIDMLEPVLDAPESIPSEVMIITYYVVPPMEFISAGHRIGFIGFDEENMPMVNSTANPSYYSISLHGNLFPYSNITSNIKQALAE